MHSSTSSSSVWSLLLRWDVPTLLIPLALLALAEVAIRHREATVSQEVAHLRAMPAAVARTVAAPTARRVVIVGNSLTRSGIDQGMLLERIMLSGASASLCVLHPSETTARDWYYLVKNQVLAYAKPPDTLVICGTQRHFADGGDLRYDIFARFIAKPADWPEIVFDDLGSAGGALELALSTYSAVWANREAVQRRVLNRAISGYGPLAQRINAQQRTQNQPADPPEHTHKYLEGMLALAREHDVAVLLVAMPVAEPYTLSDDVRQLADAHHAGILDYSGRRGYEPPDFPDGLHLSPAAATRFTRDFAAALSPLLVHATHQTAR
jgi:hypothetical protein